jgi:uncharacterized protein (DUF885 family)
LTHESFPGHLYQFNYFGLTDPHPVEQLLATTAYAEGYAEYSEYYGLLYMGFSEAEALAIFNYQVFIRALDARLELGINYQGWDLRETRTYLASFGLDAYAQEIFEDIASLPLISLPYGLGVVHFTNLLATAQLELGERFDLVEYHKVLLDNGAVPLDLLKRNVVTWLRQS